MERVSIVEAETDSSVLLIAPHGPDDDATAELTLQLAQRLGCWGVVNCGFERANNPDYPNDKLNCNNIEHLQHPVAKAEFLEPIEKFVSRMEQEAGDVNIFVIHGMADKIRDEAKDKVDMVIGYGANKRQPDNLCCDDWRKDGFIYSLKNNNVTAYGGKAGGKYAAASNVNLCQYYRQHQYNEDVHAMQIEIVKSLRTNEMMPLTVETLCLAISEYVLFIDCFLEDDSSFPDWPNDWRKIAGNVPHI